jgi:hypothetical protein
MTILAAPQPAAYSALASSAWSPKSASARSAPSAHAKSHASHDSRVCHVNLAAAPLLNDTVALRRCWLVEHHHLRNEGFHIAHVRQASSCDRAKVLRHVLGSVGFRFIAPVSRTPQLFHRKPGEVRIPPPRAAFPIRFISPSLM